MEPTEASSQTSFLQAYVRGFQYYEGMNMLNRTMPGARLQLVREHNKEYDEFAIALHLNKLKLDTSRLNPMKFCLN
ncbi:MAG: hypothetical protein M3Q95_05680 [Bacteroidota bacterium]|nr:hypothetical protein [Bacteroidota bacterium]